MLNFIFVYFFVHVALSYNAVLDIDELSSVYYNIDILKKPVLKKNDWDEEILMVVNKFGQEYICNVPEFEIVKNENKKDDNLDELVDIASLLKPMESAPCLSKKKDWWTYEFCYGSVIKQYHTEDNKVTGPILFLGKYESEYNWKNSTESRNKLEKYHSQYYVNGTRCDITGEPRRTEVRFLCEEGAGDYIKQVDEPQSCKYVVVIATTRLCHHPYLKPQSNKTPYGISCSPALTEDQYEKYQRIEEIMEEKRLSLVQKGGSSHPEVDGQDGGTPFTENETEEEETKFSIRLLTIPLSSKRNSKWRKGHDESGTKGGSSVESTPEDILDLFGEDEEISSEIDLHDGLNENELKFLMDKIRSDAEKTLKRNSLILDAAKKIAKGLSQEIGKGKEDPMGTDYSGKTNADAEGVVGVSSKNQDTAPYVPNEAPKIKQKIHQLLYKWRETQKKSDFEMDGDVSKKSIMKEMLSDFEIVFAEYPKFFKDVMNLAEKHSIRLSPYDDLESIRKRQSKLKEILSHLSETLEEAKDVTFENGDAQESMLRAYAEVQNLFADRPEFINDVMALSEEYSDELIYDEDGESLADALKDRSKLEKVVKTLDTAVQATKEKANKVREKIRSLEGLIDREVEAMRGWQTEPGAGAESNQDEEDNGVVNVLKDGEESEVRQIDSLTERILDQSHRMKLEQKIKERLKKSGLDNIGSKIEVKILSSTLDEEDKDTPVTLSPEETEAIHSLIFNVLEATAEELKERDRHQNLLDNYNFSMDESLLKDARPEEGDEGTGSDPETSPQEEPHQEEERQDDESEYLLGR